MYKIYLALGNKNLEKYLKSREKDINLMAKKLVAKNIDSINDTIKFEGEMSYKDGVLKGLQDVRPDLLIIREGLPGEISTADLMYQIRCENPTLRIIFLSGDRGVGDPLLTTLVTYNIYDIIIGTQIKADEILNRIVSPNTFANVAYLVPKISIDERTGKKLYEAPNVAPIINNIKIEEVKSSHRSEVKEEPKKEEPKKEEIKEEPQNDKLIDSYVPFAKSKENDDNKEELISPLIELENKEHKPQKKEPLNIKNDVSSDDSIKIEEEELTLEENNSLTNDEIVLEDEEILLEDEGMKLENDNLVLENNTKEEQQKEEIVKTLEKEEEKPLNVEEEKPSVDIFSELDKKRKLILEHKLETEQEQKEEPKEEESNTLEATINKKRIKKHENKYKYKSEPLEVEEEPKLNIKKDEVPLKTSQRISPKKKMEFETKDYEDSYDDDYEDEIMSDFKTHGENKRSGLLDKILGSRSNNKKDNKKIGQKIITFIGAGSGVGTSQIAFNTALLLAENKYKVMYMDLNRIRSSIETIFQFGYSDVGLDTALKGIENEDFQMIDTSISTMDKILEIEKGKEEKSDIYNTYRKLPKNLDYLFFSQDYMRSLLANKDLITFNPNMLKDLNMYLLMQEGYDFIILDVPSYMGDAFTEIATIFSLKIFFVITQDISVLTNNINYQLKFLDEKRINYKEKFYYILNKSENVAFNYNEVYKWLCNATGMKGFNIVNMPYVQRDFIKANYDGVPILWDTSSKGLQKAFSEIVKLILN